jgi:hypothetical protein
LKSRESFLEGFVLWESGFFFLKLSFILCEVFETIKVTAAFAALMFNSRLEDVVKQMTMYLTIMSLIGAVFASDCGHMCEIHVCVKVGCFGSTYAKSALKHTAQQVLM